MSNAGHKLKFAGLNLIAPGIAHLAMKRWWKGLFYLLSTLGCFAWVLASFFQLLIGNIYTAAEGGTPTVDMWSVFLPMGLIVVIWIASYVDIIFIRLEAPKKTSIEENEIAETPTSVDAADEEKIRREVARQLQELKDSGKIIVVDEANDGK